MKYSQNYEHDEFCENYDELLFYYLALCLYG